MANHAIAHFPWTPDWAVLGRFIEASNKAAFGGAFWPKPNRSPTDGPGAHEWIFGCVSASHGIRLWESGPKTDAMRREWMGLSALAQDFALAMAALGAGAVCVVDGGVGRIPLAERPERLALGVERRLMADLPAG